MEGVLLTIGVFLVIITTGLVIWLKYRKTGKIELSKNQESFLKELFSALFHSFGGDEETALSILKEKYKTGDFNPNLEENLTILKPLLKDKDNNFKKEDFEGMK